MKEEQDYSDNARIPLSRVSFGGAGICTEAQIIK